MFKAGRAFFAFIKYLKSKIPFRGTKVSLLPVIVRPTSTYGCEVFVYD